MIIEKNNFRFIRLKKEDIELVRKHRSSSDIQQFMEFRDEITPEMQEEWFNTINNNSNLYFIIEFEGKKIGLINGKNIDWDEMTMEAGVFYWDKNVYNTPLPIIASLIFGELGVVAGGLKTCAHILKDNERAIRFNKMMGFRICEGQENVKNQLYSLNKTDFLKKSGKLRLALKQILGDHPTVVHLEADDYDSGFGHLEETFIKSEYLVRNEEVKGVKKFYFDISL